MADKMMQTIFLLCFLLSNLFIEFEYNLICLFCRILFTFFSDNNRNQLILLYFAHCYILNPIMYCNHFSHDALQS